MEKPNEPQRNKTRLLFKELFIEYGFTSVKDYESHIIKLESVLYNRAIEQCAGKTRRDWNDQIFLATYSSLCYNIMYHLNAQNIAQIIAGKIDIKSISIEVLCPDALEKENTIKKIQSEQKLEVKYGKNTTCPSCNDTKVTWCKYQGHGSDELENYAYTCGKCGFAWTDADRHAN